jgi:hypothetical protein
MKCLMLPDAMMREMSISAGVESANLLYKKIPVNAARYAKYFARVR